MQAISALRATLSGMADDPGILGDNGNPNLTPVSSNAYTFPRTPAQVCSPCLARLELLALSHADC